MITTSITSRSNTYGWETHDVIILIPRPLPWSLNRQIHPGHLGGMGACQKHSFREPPNEGVASVRCRQGVASPIHRPVPITTPIFNTLRNTKIRLLSSHSSSTGLTRPPRSSSSPETCRFAARSVGPIEYRG
jgi:hypothetical protein